MDDFGSSWEHDKNAAILELDRKNKLLEAKLQEATKDDERASLQAQKVHHSIVNAIHSAFEAESRRNLETSASKDKERETWLSKLQEFPSTWEMEKNEALLELERRNQHLQNLLKSREKRAEDSIRENELIEEGYIRGKECMKLYARVRAMQGSLVIQAQRISQSRRLNAAVSSWQRLVVHSRKKKTLRKAEELWDRRMLRKSFTFLASKRAKSLGTKKLVSIACKHRTRSVLQHLFELWQLTVELKKCSSERLLVFSMLQRIRAARVAFAGWKIFRETLETKWSLDRKAKTCFVQHKFRESWKRWRSSIDSTRVKSLQADEFCKSSLLNRSLQTWSANADGCIFERTHELRIQEHKKSVLLRRSFGSWKGTARVEAVMQRRFDKIISSRTRRILLYMFLGWKQHTKNKREVSIWRKAIVLKRQQELRLCAFDCCKCLWIRSRLIRRLKTRQTSRTRLAVLKRWFSIAQEHKACGYQLQNISHKTQNRQLKYNFQRWISFIVECRKAALLKDTRILQARLELSQEDLQNAELAQAVMTKTIRSLEKEKAAMMHSMEIITARTPPWTSGFLEADLRWSSTKNHKGCVPSARVGHTAVDLRLISRSPMPSHLVVTGGYDGKSGFNDILVYHAADSTWRKPDLRLNAIEASSLSLQHRTACAKSNRIIFFGGFNGAEDSSELLILDFLEDGNSCELSKPEHRMGIAPGPISQHTSCLSRDGNTMVVFGGYRSNVGHLNELWMLDLQWMDWHLPDYFGDPPAPRRGHGAAIIDTKMYVFGGYDGKNNLGDFHQLDLKTMEWKIVECLGEVPAARRHHSVTAIGKNLVVYGGYNGVAYLDDVYSFDTGTSFWKRRRVLKPPPETSGGISGKDESIYGRSMHAMVSMGQRFVIVGGIHEYGTLGGALYLENGAAVDGLEVQKQLAYERCQLQTARQNLAQYEQMLHRKVADLAVAYSKIDECQSALRDEVQARKSGVLKQQILIQKLKKARKKTSLR